MNLARSGLAAAAAPAHAGLFDDDEAPQAHRRPAAGSVDAQAQDSWSASSARGRRPQDRRARAAATRSTRCNGEIAQLRGQLEVLRQPESSSLDKRQKDLYVDLDTRLRKFEHGRAAAGPRQAQRADRRQARAAGLRGAALEPVQGEQLRLGDPEPAVRSSKHYPQSQLAPSAQYWIGNAHYALARLQERDRRAAEADRHLARQRRRRRTRCSTSRPARPRRATRTARATR